MKEIVMKVNNIRENDSFTMYNVYSANKKAPFLCYQETKLFKAVCETKFSKINLRADQTGVNKNP